MEDWKNNLGKWYRNYCDSFVGLDEDRKRNFEIKKEHSFRVAEFSVQLAVKLDFDEKEQKQAYFIGLLHDIGRYKQLVEFNTFNDAVSVDHAEYSTRVLTEEAIFEQFGIENSELVLTAILYHNKLQLPEKLTGDELKFAKLIRDADKIDILKVLTDYYGNRNAAPNHALTWELPKGNSISSVVLKEFQEGKLISRKSIASEIDIKIMQMSWVYDLNYRPSFEYLLKKRFLESIYDTLPKNDDVIEIFRKVKVFSENKILVK